MDIKVLGIDLGKTVCSFAGLDEAADARFVVETVDEITPATASGDFTPKTLPYLLTRASATFSLG